MGGALLMGQVASAVVAQPAQAQTNARGMPMGVTEYDLSDDDQAPLRKFRFVPGKRWYTLDVDIPLWVVDQAEQKSGKFVCKIEVSRGVFISNLKPCPENHPRMYNPDWGQLRPMSNTGNPFTDLSINDHYNMRPKRDDLEFAQLIASIASGPRPQPDAVATAVVPTRRPAAELRRIQPRVAVPADSTATVDGVAVTFRIKPAAVVP